MFIDFRSTNSGGSGDAYSKAETDELLAKKANSTELTEEKGRAEQAEEVLDGKIVANTEAIQNKADKSTTYTKDEVDSALSSKADASAITDIDSKLQSKADSSDVNAIAESLSTTQEIVAQKANIGDSYTKAESDAKYLTEHQSLAEYAKTADVAEAYQPKGDYITSETDPVWNAEKTNYYNKTQVDAKLYNKADASTVYTKSQVDSALSNKTNTSFDNLTTEGKENLKSIIVGGNATVDNNHVVSSSESALKWTIDFKDTDYVEIQVTKGGASNWFGAQFSPSGEYLNVYGLGGNTSLLTLYRKDNDEQLDIYDGEGYNPTTLDNYYIKIAEGCKVTYNNAARLVSESKGMIEETDPIWNAEKVNYYTKSDVDSALSNKANSSDVYTKNQVNIELAKKANTATTYTKSEVDSKVADMPLKTINGESIKGTGNIVIQGGSGDAYTKAESDALLANKTNTNLDNISDEGKENLKNIIKGSKTNLWNEEELSHTITSDEATQKWYINYDAEVFKIWGSFQLFTQSTWEIIYNSSNTVTFNCTGTTQGIEIYDKATDAKLSSDADMSLTVPENSFYIKFDEGLVINTSYFNYMSEVFYSGDAPLYEENDPVWNKEKTNYFTKDDSYRIFALTSDLNNYSSKTQVNIALADKANSNLSNASLKTINGQSLKGMGDITIKGGDEHFQFNPEQDIVNGIAVYTKDEKLITIENQNEPIPMGTAFKFDMNSIEGTKYLNDSITFWYYKFDASEEKLTIHREMMYYEPNPLNIYKDGELVAKIGSTEEGGVSMYEISFSELSHYTFKPMCTVVDNWNFNDFNKETIPFVKPTLILGGDSEGAYVVRNSVKKEIATTDNYAELTFVDVDGNETTLLLLKKN